MQENVLSALLVIAIIVVIIITTSSYIFEGLEKKKMKNNK